MKLYQNKFMNYLSLHSADIAHARSQMALDTPFAEDKYRVENLVFHSTGNTVKNEQKY